MPYRKDAFDACAYVRDELIYHLYMKIFMICKISCHEIENLRLMVLRSTWSVSRRNDCVPDSALWNFLASRREVVT